MTGKNLPKTYGVDGCCSKKKEEEKKTTVDNRDYYSITKHTKVEVKLAERYKIPKFIYLELVRMF